MTKISYSSSLDSFLSSKCTKIRFWPGLRLAPRWGSLRRSPRSASRLGRGYPSPFPFPSRRLRRLELGAIGSQAPSTQNPGYAIVVACSHCKKLSKANEPARQRVVRSVTIHVRYLLLLQTLNLCCDFNSSNG